MNKTLSYCRDNTYLPPKIICCPKLDFMGYIYVTDMSSVSEFDAVGSNSCGIV